MGKFQLYQARKHSGRQGTRWAEEMRRESSPSINYSSCTSSRIEACAAQSNSCTKTVDLHRGTAAIHRGQQQNSFSVFYFICWSLVSFALGVYEDPLTHFHPALFCDVALQALNNTWVKSDCFVVLLVWWGFPMENGMKRNWCHSLSRLCSCVMSAIYTEGWKRQRFH